MGNAFGWGKSTWRVLLSTVVFAGAFGVTSAWAQGYAGSKACAACHEKQYEQFIKYSKKAHSWKSISGMVSDLTKEEREGCYECHTTGYGKGGFVSYEKTPEFADVGCETCHGAGAEHVESGGDPAAIRKTPELATCTVCHNESRVEAFGFKPLIHSGAH